MDFRVTGKLGEYYLAEQHRQNAAGGSEGVSFAKLAAAKAAGQSDVSGMSFKDMWQARYPGAYYNVMDTSKIDGSLWGRNDYPWDKYFSNHADASVLDWKPSGAEPAMLDSDVQAKINSTIGKKAVVVPPELEEKMKNDPELAESVMAKVAGFIAQQDIMNPNPRKGYLIALDENGDIAHACVTSEKMSVSSAEFIEARKAREEKRAEYAGLNEESALKRRLLEQEADERYYKDSIYKKAVSIAAYEAAGNEQKTKELKAKLAQVEAELSVKDTAEYKRRHAEYTTEE